MYSEKSKEIVVQSNRLIEAHYRLTLQEKRIILWLIKEIKSDDTDFKKYMLKIADFAEMVGLHPKTQYKEMKKVTRALIGRVIEIENPETNATTQMAWLCFAHWEPNKGVCYLEFHPALKPYLLQLNAQFTKICFSDLLGLKSVYAVRLFELLIQYESIGKREISITKLRAWFGICPEEYKLYGHLKVKVINQATTEINAKTEYDVSYEEIKESRKIVKIKWNIKKKTHFEKAQIEKAIIIQKELRCENAVIHQLLEYGFTDSQSKKIIKSNSQETIINAIKSVDIQVLRGKVKNPKAMLTKAIQEKWHPEKYQNNVS
jgi:plasmid replication initiation protein